MSSGPSFEIGLVMAGAISAGAYSAGVIDFLIEALDSYEAAKSQTGWDGPTHAVKLPVIAGASAGGMTAALAALHLFRDLEHVRPRVKPPVSENNRLYSSWVTDVSIERLLETSDLPAPPGSTPGVRSALCCTVLEDIVARAFVLSGAPRQRAWVGRDNDQNLTVILTVSNLRGVPYSFKIFGDRKDERYGMLNHGDYLEFKIGIPQGGDGQAVLDIRNTSEPNWDLLRKGALATGAFPIGLVPRMLKRSMGDYFGGWRVGSQQADGSFKAMDPDPHLEPKGIYEFISVDGGLIDNEPLELARRYLSGGPNRHNNRNGNEARRALILIDPFPNFQTLPLHRSDNRIISVLPSLLSTLVDQARFKPEELALAADDRVFSRFMIAPTRVPQGADRTLAHTLPIASGSLGGFGGFLHESFRRHDYLLGRRNAQAFLRWHFALPESNPLFNDFDPAKREKWYVRAVEDKFGVVVDDKRYPFTMVAPRTNPQEEAALMRALPIIPLVGQALVPIEIAAEDLPNPKDIKIRNIRKMVDRRTDKLLKALLGSDLARYVDKWWLRWAARWFLQGIIVNMTIAKITSAQETVQKAFEPR
jgi:hypothetical protein